MKTRREVIPALYFIKRGPRPEYHRAPFHPLIICSRKCVAKWEAGWTGDRAWMWSHAAPHAGSGGWLLERWEGLDVDYGHLVRTCTLPDGTHTAFFHQHRDLGYAEPGNPQSWQGYDPNLQEPWSLLPQAVWWSDHRIPDWLVALGVKLPEDEFSLGRIIEHTQWALEEQRKKGIVRIERPTWWPERGMDTLEDVR